MTQYRRRAARGGRLGRPGGPGRPARSRDRGQVALEYLGFIPILMTVALAAVQPRRCSFQSP